MGLSVSFSTHFDMRCYEDPNNLGVSWLRIEVLHLFFKVVSESESARRFSVEAVA
jgi:hypothetical protein